VKLARVRKPKATCFLLYVEYKPNTNTSNIIYNITYTYKYIQNMYLKVGLVEEMKEGGKEGNRDSK
jgi:hypothetical protein